MTWTINQLKQRCGGADCNRDIAVGAPLLVIFVAGTSRRLHRCGLCGQQHVAMPEVIRAADFNRAVPLGITYQPSLGGLEE